MSCFMLRTIHSLVVVGILALGLAPMARAQDTDGITVHCAGVVFVVHFGACTGPGADIHPTIQLAVGHAEPGETVLVGVGVFPEQVTIDKPLTLEGEGVSMTSIKPLTVSANTSNLFSGAPIAAILLVDETTGVAVSDVTIDGSVAAFNACTPDYVGIFYRASSGVIQATHVTHIHHPLASGCQGVLGIFVQSGNRGPGLNSNVTILQSMVDDYGKNGITANEPGTFVTVSSNTVTGRGPTVLGDAAQNGVQIGFGARGLVSGNTISMHDYVPPDFVACGLLFFQAGGGLGRAKSNTFVANEQDICTAGVGPSPNSPFNQ
jgi:nitrous oxidase accessory protein NosD